MCCCPCQLARSSGGCFRSRTFAVCMTADFRSPRVKAAGFIHSLQPDSLCSSANTPRRIILKTISDGKRARLQRSSAIVNEEFAREFYSGVNLAGKVFHDLGAPDKTYSRFHWSAGDGADRNRPLRRHLYIVIQRRNEISVRMALGANRSDILHGIAGRCNSAGHWPGGGHGPDDRSWNCGCFDAL